MRKLIVLILLLALCLSGCDSNNKDIEITHAGRDFDTTEVWRITTYNGYNCTMINNQQNEDGSYIVTM